MGQGRYKIYLAACLIIAFGGLGAVAATGASPRLGLDLEGGIGVILTARGEGSSDEAILGQAVAIIRQRIDALGVAEPEVSIAGSNNILVQLPGVEDEEQALELIGTTAQLTFREVLRDVPGADPGRVLGEDEDDGAPSVTEETGPEVADEPVVYPLQDQPGTLLRLAPAALTGEVVRDAEAIIDPTTGAGWFVSIDMNSEGSEQWSELTAEQACQRDRGQDDRIAIVLDGEIVSAPGMDPSVECDVGITGGESRIDTGGEEEAKDLALVLRYGSLPLTLEQSEVRNVSATLGRDSLEAGIRAGAIGLGLLLIYVLLYYRVMGLVVWVGLLVFTAMIYSLMAFLGETAGLALTLAGVAGIIVSIGITTDSFIVALERLKDEFREGKTLRAAVQRGTARAVNTMLVADVVTGSAAVILFVLAVGPVRGFALTLGLATLIDVFLIFFFIRPALVLLSNTRAFTEGRFLGMKEALGGGRS